MSKINFTQCKWPILWGIARNIQCRVATRERALDALRDRISEVPEDKHEAINSYEVTVKTMTTSCD